MLLRVLDGQGQAQTIIAVGQATVTDRSGNIQAEAAQHVMEENPDRSGWWFKNTGGYDMYVNDVDDATAEVTSFKVEPGGIWPPAGYTPVSTNALSVIGTPGDTYLAREW